MTHDEFLKATAAGELTAEQQREIDEHIATCPDCAAAVEADDTSSAINAWWLAVAAVLFLALWAWREVGIRVARERLRSERAEVVELKSEKDVLVAQRDRLVEQLGVMSSPTLRTVNLAGHDGSGASARLFVDPAQHRAVMVAIGLPNSGPDLEYQVWLYGPDSAKATRGAAFDSSGGHGVVAIEGFSADVKSVSVTLEKNGGAASPSEHVVLEGVM